MRADIIQYFTHFAKKQTETSLESPKALAAVMKMQLKSLSNSIYKSQKYPCICLIFYIYVVK